MENLRIGFDAVRAFNNKRGLGSYSRNIINLMSTQFPKNEYLLFTPRTLLDFDINENCRVIKPEGFMAQKFHKMFMTTDIMRHKVDIFHGLSHSLPDKISRLNVPTVVTMHDLIYMKNPEFHPLIDRISYSEKYTRACREADRIIAISQATKFDIVEFMEIDENKIDVVHQTCNSVFSQPIPQELIEKVQRKYALPSQFMLTVAALEKRKNIELVLRAMKDKVDMPFVVVGPESPYQSQLYELAQELHVNDRFKIINDIPIEEVSAFYKLASVMIYPSFSEGFGLPILEAMTVGVPVVASNLAVFHEVGDTAIEYVTPTEVDELSEVLLSILNSEEKQKQMSIAGKMQAEKFKPEVIAQNIWKVYEKAIDSKTIINTF